MIYSSCSICSICLENIETNECTRTCGHTFHIQCNKQWDLVKPSCPLCRQISTNLHVTDKKIHIRYLVDIGILLVENAPFHELNLDEMKLLASHFNTDCIPCPHNLHFRAKTIQWCEGTKFSSFVENHISDDVSSIVAYL